MTPDLSAARTAERVARADGSPDVDEVEVIEQRCAAGRARDRKVLGGIESRVGDLFNTPWVGLLSQIALELEVLI